MHINLINQIGKIEAQCRKGQKMCKMTIIIGPDGIEKVLKKYFNINAPGDTAGSTRNATDPR